MTATVISGVQPALVIRAGDGPGVLVNRDLVNVAYLNDDQAYNVQDVDASILDPLVGIPFDGSENVYALAAAGVSLTVDYIKNALNWTPSPAQAAASISALGLARDTTVGGLNTGIPNNIAVTGTPLLHGVINRLNASGAATIAVPAAGFAFPLINGISKPGYLLNISVRVSAAATVPFLQIQLNWKDSVTGLQTGNEHWYIPASSAGTILTIGKGPTKGDQLAINLQNLDPAQAMTVTLAVWETTHSIARDDWRSDQPLNVPGLTATTCDPFGGLIINQVGTLPANSSAFFLMPLYAGKLSIYAAMNQTGKIQFNAMQPAGPPGTSYVNNQLGVQPITAGTPAQFEQDTGRWPIICLITNTTALLASYTITGTVVEFAS